MTISERWCGLALWIVLVSVLASPWVASAEGGAPAAGGGNGPRAVVEETVRDVLVVLVQRDRSSEERIDAIEAIAYRVFDFTTISKLVLARHWKKMSKDERGEFVAEFKRLLSRSYGSRIDRYEHEKVDFVGKQDEPRGDVTIKTRIRGGEFDGVSMNYRMRHRKDRWRVIDVVIEGVSLVSSYRSQFREVIAKEGTGGLLAKMHDKNFKVRIGDGES